MANKPNIRFKGFTDDWEQRKVAEITKFHKQGFYTTEDYSEKKKYYLLRGTNLTENNLILKDTPKIDATEKDYQAFKTEVGDFLIVRSGTVGTYGIVYEDIPAIFGSYLIDFRFDMEQVTNEFFGYFYQSESFKSQLRQIVQQSANTNINAENIKSTSIMLPIIDEQKKIGDYLAQLDCLITLHQRKCDETKKLKKFMLQKMFPKDGEKIPEIRFDGFTNDWEQRKLGELCERLTRKNKDNESDLPLTISSQLGLIDQRDFFNKVVAAKDMSDYYLLQNGEFAYNKSYSSGYEYGSIKRLNAYEKGCLSTLYICFNLISDRVDSNYLECYFDTLQWYGDVSKICAEGARNHGLLNVDTKAFFTDVTIKIPIDIKEQQQISTLLNNLDHLITLHQRKCDQLKQIKKYMLQNMFPQKG